MDQAVTIPFGACNHAISLFTAGTSMPSTCRVMGSARGSLKDRFWGRLKRWQTGSSSSSTPSMCIDTCTLVGSFDGNSLVAVGAGIHATRTRVEHSGPHGGDGENAGTPRAASSGGCAGGKGGRSDDGLGPRPSSGHRGGNINAGTWAKGGAKQMVMPRVADGNAGHRHGGVQRLCRRASGRRGGDSVFGPRDGDCGTAGQDDASQERQGDCRGG